MSDVTRILDRIEAGDPEAADELLRSVYEELRKLAACKLAREAADQTLQPTALVHEAWLRLIGGEPRVWGGRAHFFAAAAEAMRRILIDNARRKRAVKHGGDLQRLDFDLDGVEVAATADDDTVLRVNDALELLAREDPDSAELIKLRFFVGLTNEEAARALGISERSARRYWSFARAWLYRELSRRGASTGA